MAVFTLAAKDLRLLLRDPRSAVILLFMPVVLILVLGAALGEGFGEKPDDRLRISFVNLDRGLGPRPPGAYPPGAWADAVVDDLSSDAEGAAGRGAIRVERIDSLDAARGLVSRGSRAAVLVFEPDFSDRMGRCSFLAAPGFEPVNPLGRDGVQLDRVGLTVLADPTQPTASSIIEQAAQVTLFRVVIPYMIGQAFARIGDERFMEVVAARLKDEKVPPQALVELEPAVQHLLSALFDDRRFDAMLGKEFPLTSGQIKRQLPGFRKLIGDALRDEQVVRGLGEKIAFGEVITPAVRARIGPPVKAGVGELFPSYDFHALTWGQLTRSRGREGSARNRAVYEEAGAKRYQVLVPQYTVMFAFFLVLTVGWLFVAERKHGTIVRLRAAPLGRGQVLLGKLIPCLVVSLAQGAFLLAAGRALFGISWGAEPWLLAPVAACTSLAAVGLAMLVASVARNETQVAVYGTLLVLVLGGVSGSLMPRELMPESMKRVSLATPQAWALDAYAQVLGNPTPDLSVVGASCLALAAFGGLFLALAWWRLDLE